MLLCVGNGGFCRKADGLYEDAQTVCFLVELAQMTGGLTACQPVVDYRNGECFCEQNLTGQPHLRLVGLELWRSSRVLKSVSYLCAVPRLAREINRTDWVYLFMPGNVSLLCGLLAVALRKPFGVYLRGELIIAPPLTRLVMSRTRFVLASSPHLCERARKSCGDVELVTPMLDLAVEDIVGCRAQRKSGPWNILFVGRVESRKGILELVKAAELLRAKGVDFVLNLAGGGPELGQHQRSLPGGLANRVQFLGAVADRHALRELYLKADVFVFPSHDEGFPRVLYEAMAFGAPIITTFVGGISSVMSDGVNCLRIDVGHAEQIASRTLELINDADLRARISKEASRSLQKLMAGWSRSHAQQVSGKVMANRTLPASL